MEPVGDLGLKHIPGGGQEVAWVLVHVQRL